MRALPRASLLLSHLLLVAYCARRPALDAGPFDLSAPPDRVFAAGGPLTPGALLEGSSPRTGRRTPSWRLLKRLPLLVGASTRIGVPPASTLGAVHGSWGPALASQASPVEAAPQRGLPAALAVRGGAVDLQGGGEEFDPSAVAAKLEGAQGSAPMGGHGSPELDPPELGALLAQADVSRAEVFPTLDTLDTETATAEFRAMLLSDRWLAVTEAPKEIWCFEFIDFGGADGLWVDMSFSGTTLPLVTLGAEVVKLAPRIVGGRFRGFEGTDGFFLFRFMRVGDDIRVDMDHPADGLAIHNFLMFAGQIPGNVIKFVRAKSVTTTEMKDSFRLNLQRLAWPTNPRVQELMELVDRGRWYGWAEPIDGKVLEWHIQFGRHEHNLIALVVTSGDFGTARHHMPLKPLFVDENFYGFFGKHDDEGGLRAQYLFSILGGTLFVQINHDVDDIVHSEGKILKFRIFFHLWEGDPVAA